MKTKGKNITKEIALIILGINALNTHIPETIKQGKRTKPPPPQIIASITPQPELIATMVPFTKTIKSKNKKEQNSKDKIYHKKLFLFDSKDSFSIGPPKRNFCHYTKADRKSRPERTIIIQTKAKIQEICLSKSDTIEFATLVSKRPICSLLGGTLSPFLSLKSQNFNNFVNLPKDTAPDEIFIPPSEEN